VLYGVVLYPRTDDAEVTANFIGIAPVVEGPVVELPIHDNDLVKKGDLLYKLTIGPTCMLCRMQSLLRRSSKARLRMNPVESPLRSTALMWRTQASRAPWRMRQGG
jgi:hypothetical protein